MTRIGLGFRVVRGGSVVVGVSADEREPSVVLSTFLATAHEGDRLSLEPHHVAAEIVRSTDGGDLAAADTLLLHHLDDCQFMGAQKSQMP